MRMNIQPIRNWIYIKKHNPMRLYPIEVLNCAPLHMRKPIKREVIHFQNHFSLEQGGQLHQSYLYLLLNAVLYNLQCLVTAVK